MNDYSTEKDERVGGSACNFAGGNDKMLDRMNGNKRNSQLYILLMVGVVSAFGPFVTDFYLPALPSLMGYFDTTASMVQLSLTFSMVGLALGQLVIGPLSDKYGRKVPLDMAAASGSMPWR